MRYLDCMIEVHIAHTIFRPPLNKFRVQASTTSPKMHTPTNHCHRPNAVDIVYVYNLKMSANVGFQCIVCRCRFKANFTLWRHVWLCHPEASLPNVQRTGRKPKNGSAVKCIICGEVLSNTEAMRYHRKQKHGPLAATTTSSVTNPVRCERQKKLIEFDTVADAHSLQYG